MTKYKLDRWKTLIAEWQRSGKTREKFCKEKDVTVATFSYWRTKNQQARKGKPRESSERWFHPIFTAPDKNIGIQHRMA
jgi:hypothetical protein